MSTQTTMRLYRVHLTWQLLSQETALYHCVYVHSLSLIWLILLIKFLVLVMTICSTLLLCSTSGSSGTGKQGLISIVFCMRCTYGRQKASLRSLWSLWCKRTQITKKRWYFCSTPANMTHACLQSCLQSQL